MSIKIFKISYFSFTFKLNEKKKVPLKIWFGEGDVARNILSEGVLIFNMEVGYVSKRGINKKEVEK